MSNKMPRSVRIIAEKYRTKKGYKLPIFNKEGVNNYWVISQEQFDDFYPYIYAMHNKHPIPYTFGYMAPIKVEMVSKIQRSFEMDRIVE